MELEKIISTIVDDVRSTGVDLSDMEFLMHLILAHMDEYPELDVLENSIEAGTEILERLIQ